MIIFIWCNCWLRTLIYRCGIFFSRNCFLVSSMSSNLISSTIFFLVFFGFWLPLFPFLELPFSFCPLHPFFFFLPNIFHIYPILLPKNSLNLKGHDTILTWPKTLDHNGIGILIELVWKYLFSKLIFWKECTLWCN